ncbi:MAG: hypothetical protein ACI87N_002554 [Flavobacteriales bacterium]|jgi:hypothetical protein
MRKIYSIMVVMGINTTVTYFTSMQGIIIIITNTIVTITKEVLKEAAAVNK